MSEVRVRVQGDGLIRFAEAAELLASEAKARRVYVRAIDHTGRKAFTAVRRAAAKQVGLTNRRLTELGRLKFASARHSIGNPQAEINSTGKHISLKEFRPTQLRAGTKASPWGRRQLFDGAFIFAGHRGSGQRMPGGHVFVNSGKLNPRSGRRNLPVMLWGPAIPNEIVKGESRDAFTATARDLPERIAHELRRATGGAVG